MPLVRDQKGNDWQKGTKCGVCASPLRRLHAASRGAGKGSRLQRSNWRICQKGHKQTT